MKKQTDNLSLQIKSIDQPIDSVSQIVWDKHNPVPSFVTASWDGHITYYTITHQGVVKGWHYFLKQPVLSVDLHPENIAFAGLSDGSVICVKPKQNAEIFLYCHQKPICKLFWIQEKNILISLGFDQVMFCWDLIKRQKKQYILPFKTITAYQSYPYLLLGSNENKLALMNLNIFPELTLPTIEDYQNIGLQTYSKLNCCMLRIQKRTIALGTIDGKSLLVTFDQNLKMKKQWSNQGQRKIKNGNLLVGQVNAISLGIYKDNIFLVGGGSFSLEVQNLFQGNSTILASVNRGDGAVNALCLNPAMNYLVYSTGCDWSSGLYELQAKTRTVLHIQQLTPLKLSQYVKK